MELVSCLFCVFLLWVMGMLTAYGGVNGTSISEKTIR